MIGQLTPALRKVLHNTAWLMVDRIVRMGLGLLVSVWIARYLGPTQYGILSFAISFVALFGTMSTLGLDGIVVRHLVTGGADSNEILGTAFVLRLLGGILAPLLAVASIHFMEPNDPITLLLVSLLSVGLFFQAFDTIDVYFQAQVQSKVTVWAKNAAFLLVAGIRVFLVQAKAPLWTFAAAQVTELALGALGLMAMYRWRGGRVSIWRAIQLLQQSWPVILTGMAIMIYSRIDMVMLKYMQGDAAVGLYATATRISEVWYFVPVAIVSSVSPAIIRAKDNPRIYYERIGKLFSLMSLIALVIGSGIALSSHWIIHVLYTEAFRGAAPVLAVHVWASLFVSGRGPRAMEYLTESPEAWLLQNSGGRRRECSAQSRTYSKVLGNGCCNRDRDFLRDRGSVRQCFRRPNAADIRAATEIRFSTAIIHGA
jgi:PST family polysaccharide transporter